MLSTGASVPRTGTGNSPGNVVHAGDILDAQVFLNFTFDIQRLVAGLEAFEESRIPAATARMQNTWPAVSLVCRLICSLS